MRFGLAPGCALLLAVLALFAYAPLAAAADSPAAPIAAIYKRAAAGKGDSGGQFVWLHAKSRPRYLSASLTKLWNDADAKVQPGDAGPPGFDPVSSSQDPLVRNVKVAVEKQDRTTATVAASFDSWPPGNTLDEQRKNPPKRLTVRYDMVRERGAWKIDDIRGTVDGREWSIRQVLREEP